MLEELVLLLKQNNILYSLRNNGHHYLLFKGSLRADYWPKYGKWHFLKTGERGVGINALIAAFNGSEQKLQKMHPEVTAKPRRGTRNYRQDINKIW